MWYNTRGKRSRTLSVLTVGLRAHTVNKVPSRVRGGFLCGDSVLAFLFPILPHVGYGGVFPISAKELLINEEIKAKEVRVIGPDGETLGIMSASAALSTAYDQGYDLVLMAPQATPPVCRIMDYGKYKFERDKKEKEAKKKQQVIELKEIQLSCRIDTHDFETKLRHARRFLEGGNKVRVVMRFKGREMSHVGIGQEIMKKFEDACQDLGAADKAPVLEGRFMSMVLTPLKYKSN